MPNNLSASIMCANGLMLMCLNLAVHLGFTKLDNFVLIAANSIVCGLLAMSYYQLVTEFEREKRRLSSITQGIHTVLGDHERRLPPPTE